MTTAQSLLDALRSQALTVQAQYAYEWAYARTLVNDVLIEALVNDFDCIYSFTNGRVYLTSANYSQATRLAQFALTA